MKAKDAPHYKWAPGEYERAVKALETRPPRRKRARVKQLDLIPPPETKRDADPPLREV